MSIFTVNVILGGARRDPWGFVQHNLGRKGRILLSLAVIGAVFYFTAPSARAVDKIPFAEDLSVLFPLPGNRAEFEFLWSIGEVAAFGPLLPQDLYEQLPPLTRTSLRMDLDNQTRVVGLRIDPCFKEKIGSQCRPQIRLVAQPLFEFGRTVACEDSAFHLFYEVTGDEVRELVVALSLLRERVNATSEPPEILGVHRILKKRGLKSSYASALKSLVFRLIGESRLSRVTFTLIRGHQNVWHFAGVDRVPQEGTRGVWQSFEIPNVEKQRMLADKDGSPLNFFVQTIGRSGGLGAAVSPKPNSAKDGMTFSLKDETDTAGIQSLISETRKLNRIENPGFHTPGSMDCVSCHAAGATKRVLAARRGLQALSLEDIYRPTKAAISAEIQSQPQFSFSTNFRAFGYFGISPIISQRTANETSAILETMKK